jgi:phospholipid/cholesterol/gamma-HCH transport system substrate-binding protein
VKGKTLGAAIKLIIFAVVTTLAAGLLGVVISNRTFGKTKEYHAVFSDVTNLLTGNDVRMAGVRVGTVKSIDVTNRDQAIVGFNVDQDVPMTTTTRVQVHYLNLVGQRYLDLITTPGSTGDTANCTSTTTTTPGCQNPNVAIPISRTAPAVDLTALFNGFRPLFQALTPADVNSFSLEIIKTLQGEGGTVDSLLTQTASLTKTVANRDAVIGQVVNNLLSVLTTVQQRNAGLDETITQLQRLVTGLAGDRNTIAASLSHIDDLASNSASFIKGVRPFLPGDLRALRNLAHNLNTTKDVDGTGNNALAGILEREPAKLNRITRTATYGGYFNFWLCELNVAGLPFKIGPPTQAASPSCPVSGS